MSDKRQNVISWDECFMRLAETIALRSKDPSTQVGACIINPDDHRIISLGYNGLPFGCSDDEFNWGKCGEFDNKYLYVVHAELNAILSAHRDLSGCRIYVTHFPCNECMKALIQAGIKEVYYLNPYKPNSNISVSSMKMAKASGVKLVKFERNTMENHKPRILISLGMHGVDEATVRNKINEVTEKLKDTYDCVHNFDTKGTSEDTRLYYLGEAIKKMDKCDGIYLCKGWELHKGCVIEREIATLYDKFIIYE